MSRHHHLTVLAAAWWLTQDERYAEAAADQLRSWWSANPFLTGVHWTSGIEAGIRLISWTWIRRLLDDWPKVGDLFEHNDDAVRQIGWHQEFLAAFPSRGSSANNHVVAEAAGRLVAACAFPWYDREPPSGGRARRRCWSASSPPTPSPTASTASWPPTTTASSSSSAWWPPSRPTRTVTPLSEATWATLARMLDAAAAIVDVTGRPPRQGDGDEGRALVLDDPERDPWASAPVHRRGPAGRAPAGGRRSPSGDPGGPVRGPRASTRGCPRPAERPGRFADAGLVLLRSRTRTARRSGAGATAGRTASCPSRRTPTPTRSRWRCGTTASTSSPTRAPTATTASRTGGSGSARRRPTTPSRSAGSSQSESGGPFLWNTQATDDDPGQRRRRAGRADLERRARRLPAAEPGGHPSPVGDAGLAGPPPDGRRHPRRPAAPVEPSLRWQLGPDVQVELDGAYAALSWSVGGERRRGRLTLPTELDLDLAPRRDRPDRGLVLPPFRHPRPGHRPGRPRDCLRHDPSRHRTGVAMSAQVADFRSHAAALRRRARVLIAAAVRGSGRGRRLRGGRAAPADQHHTGSAADTGSGREQQLRRDHPGAHRHQRQHLAAAGRAVDPALPARDGREDDRGLRPRPTSCIQIDGDLDQRGRGPGAVPGGGGRVRQLRPRHRSRGDDGGAGGPHKPEGRTAGADRPDAEGDRGHEHAQKAARPGLRRKAERKRGCWRACATEQANLALQLDKVEDKIAAGTPVGSSAGAARRSSSRRPRRSDPRRGCGCSSGPRSVPLAASIAGCDHCARRRPTRLPAPTARRHRRRSRQPGAGGGPQPATAVGGRVVHPARDLPGDAGRVVGVAPGAARSGAGGAAGAVASRRPGGPSAVADGGVALR